MKTLRIIAILIGLSICATATAGNAHFTSVNSRSISCGASCMVTGYEPVMTLTLPDGKYLIHGDLQVGYSSNVVTCILSDSVGQITLQGQTTTPNSFATVAIVMSLQAAEVYTGTSTTVSLECTWSNQSQNISIGSGTLSAISVNEITVQ